MSGRRDRRGRGKRRAFDAGVGTWPSTAARRIVGRVNVPGSHARRAEPDDRHRLMALRLLRRRGLSRDREIVAGAAAVLTAAERVWAPSVALVWLQSPNADLDHAAPIDVLAVRGPADVLAAVERELAGAY